MRRTEKGKLVQFWIDREKYDIFLSKCLEKGYSQSGWLRAQIEKLIKEDKSK